MLPETRVIHLYFCRW